MAFVPFRHKSNGVVEYYPEHFADDPNLSADLERYFPEDDMYEEDKVVDENHQLPVEQRSRVVATPIDELNVEELKTALRDNGLSTSGNKDELAARLADNTPKDDKNAD